LAGDIRNIIKHCELFWNLTNDQLDKLASIATEETFCAGQRIFTEGTVLQKLYVIGEGKAPGCDRCFGS
jgi:signal-transduction protein with cAMP-binding, CBS, and nucleotidyltransferase domain